MSVVLALPILAGGGYGRINQQEESENERGKPEGPVSGEGAEVGCVSPRWIVVDSHLFPDRDIGAFPGPDVAFDRALLAGWGEANREALQDTALDPPASPATLGLVGGYGGDLGLYPWRSEVAPQPVPGRGETGRNKKNSKATLPGAVRSVWVRFVHVAVLSGFRLTATVLSGLAE